MSEFEELFDDAFRDYVVPGIPSSGAHNVRKSDVRYIGEVLDGRLPVRARLYGTTTTAAQVALNFALLAGRPCLFEEDDVYTGTQLTIPSGSHIIGEARFVFDGLLPGGLAGDGVSTVTIGDNAKIERLRIHTPGTDPDLDPEDPEDLALIQAVDHNALVVALGTGFDIDYLEITAGQPRLREGVRTGRSGRIGHFKSVNVDRPFFGNAALEEDSEIEVEFFDIDGYLRGVRCDYSVFTVHGFDIRGRSPNALKEPGHNGFLLTLNQRVSFPNGGRVADSAEHGIRNSGTLIFESGHLYIHTTGGCGYKSNPGGGPDRSMRTRIAGISGVNIGQEGGANNELVRASRSDDIVIGPMHSVVEEGYLAPTRALQLNNCHGVVAGPITGEYRNAIVAFAGNSDTGSIDSLAGPVDNFSIEIGDATCGGSAVRFEATTIGDDKPVMTVGRGTIRFCGARGWENALHSFGYDGSGSFDPVEITDRIEFVGHIGGDLSPLTTDDGTGPGHDLITYALTWRDKVRIGTAAHLRNSGSAGLAMQELVVPPDSVFAGDGDEPARGLVFNGRALEAGTGYSVALEWTRKESLRRAAAIAMLQEGAAAQQTSLDFLVGGAGVTTDALIRVLRLSYRNGGVVNLPTISTYADNAAALAGGLVANDVYKTATGELRIVV